MTQKSWQKTDFQEKETLFFWGFLAVVYASLAGGAFYAHSVFFEQSLWGVPGCRCHRPFSLENNLLGSL